MKKKNLYQENLSVIAAHKLLNFKKQKQLQQACLSKFYTPEKKEQISAKIIGCKIPSR